MSRLLRLYPAAWRDRYGEEVADLLAEHPPTAREMLDLVRGALDAHLHRSMVPAAAGAGGSMSVPGDVPVARRRIPIGAFLGTLSAGLFLVAAAAIQLAEGIMRIAPQLAGLLAVFAVIALGLTLLVTTGRAVIAKLASVLLLLGLGSLAWTHDLRVSGPVILVAVGVLALGSLVERQPSRLNGLGIAALTVALAATYAGESEWDWIALIVAGFALVAIRLARSQGGSWRPIVGGLAGTIVAVALLSGFALATSPLRLHNGFAVSCDTTPEEVCLGRIDLVTERFRRIRPDDRIISGSVTRDGTAEICAEVVLGPDGRNPFDDPAWVATIDADTTLGIDMASGWVTGKGTEGTCWRD